MKKSRTKETSKSPKLKKKIKKKPAKAVEVSLVEDEFIPTVPIYHDVYDPKFHPEQIIALMKGGITLPEVCAAWGISRDMLDAWVRIKPEMRKALMIAREMAEAYWSRLGRDMTEGKVYKCQPRVFWVMMKNNFGWTDEGRDPFMRYEEHSLQFFGDDDDTEDLV